MQLRGAHDVDELHARQGPTARPDRKNLACRSGLTITFFGCRQRTAKHPRWQGTGARLSLQVFRLVFGSISVGISVRIAPICREDHSKRGDPLLRRRLCEAESIMDSHAISSIWGNSSSDALRPTTSTSSGRNTPSRRFLNGSHLNPLNNQSPLLGWNLSGSAATNPSTPTRPVAPPPGLGFSNSHPSKPPVDVPDMMRRFQSLKSHEYSKDALIEVRRSTSRAL